MGTAHQWPSRCTIGCVSRPVATGTAGVTDGVGRVAAEDSGEHGGRDLLAELVEDRQPHPARCDADHAKSAPEADCLEVASGS